MTTSLPITIRPSLPHPTFNVIAAADRTHLPDSLIVFRLMLPLRLQAQLHEKQGPKEEEDPHTESEKGKVVEPTHTNAGIDQKVTSGFVHHKHVKYHL